MKRMLDDLRLGEVFACGSFRLSREEIVDFATRYDPQPWHLSDELAAATIFRTLCASGIQTQAISIGLMVRAVADVHVIAGGSLNQATFFAPVRPDADYSVSAVWTEIRPSRTKPDRGAATIDVAAHDADGAVAMTCGVTYIVGRRAPGG